jgi:hypothetical protein
MSDKEILTGPHNENQEREEELKKQDDQEVDQLNKAIDVAGDLVAWTKTPAGRDTVDRLQRESHKAMNDLFRVIHEEPELGKLIAAVALFESSITMLRRFTGAQDDLDTLMSELTLKRPSAASEAMK